MNTTIEMFIGENNKTHKLDVETIKQVLNKYHNGFTIYQGIGSWRGHEELTAIILISDKQNRIMTTMALLKKLLNQEAIAYHVVAPLELI